VARVNPLVALVKECQEEFRDRNGVELTYGDIARRSGALSRQRVQQIASGQVRTMLPAETIRALSKGLQVSEAEVTRRALAAAGYTVPDAWHGATRAADYAPAARRGIPMQTQIDAAEPDPNVDPPGPDSGA
jgi:hypothetical protein